MRSHFVKIFFLFILLTHAFSAFGQQPGKGPPPAGTTGDDFIHIRFSDEFTYKVVGIDTLKKLVGSVELNQDSVFLFCDSALIVNSSTVTAQGNFILQHGDSTTIFSDSAAYNSLTKIAELYSNVSMLNGRQKLFTEKLTYNANTKIATYLTGATLTDDTTFLTSVKGYFNTETDDIFFKESVVVVSPDFTLRSDTLKYNATSQIVTFLAPTLIQQDTARIYTEAGFYDIDEKKASFTKKPQYLKNDQKAWARIMRYDGNKKEVTLVGDAHFEDSTTYATADFITYNEELDITTLEGNAFIQDEDRTITGEKITYDARNETYTTRGRSHIVDGEKILDADQVDYDKEKDVGTAAGNVIWVDTTENMTVRCEFAEHSKKRNYLKASGGRLGRPLLIKIIDNDSLFVSADTLMSLELSASETVKTQDSTAVSLTEQPAKDSVQADTLEKTAIVGKPPLPEVSPTLPVVDSVQLLQRDSLTPEGLASLQQRQGPPPSVTGNKDDTTRIILAFHDVRIFKSDLQAICDSLSYSTRDSMFRLYQNPVTWSDTSQFTADTVQIQLANDQIDRIFMRQNSFIINSPDEVFFNQIKGKNSTAFFEAGKLRRVRVTGNAESVYYALDDDDAYIGVNQIICSEMLMLFDSSKVEGIKFYTEPKATLFPMKQADHEKLKMPGFRWQIDKRPDSLEDLFTPKKKEEPVPIPFGNPDEEPKLPAAEAPEPDKK